MMKRVIISVIALFVLWWILDFIIHGMVLGQSYQETASLWRPMEEMRTGLMNITSLILAVVFVMIYYKFFEIKSVKTAISYGLLLGVGIGAPMGYGSYAVMPIPYHMALTWFLGTLVKTTLAGLLVGLLVKSRTD